MSHSCESHLTLEISVLLYDAASRGDQIWTFRQESTAYISKGQEIQEVIHGYLCYTDSRILQLIRFGGRAPSAVLLLTVRIHCRYLTEFR